MPFNGLLRAARDLAGPVPDLSAISRPVVTAAGMVRSRCDGHRLPACRGTRARSDRGTPSRSLRRTRVIGPLYGRRRQCVGMRLSLPVVPAHGGLMQYGFLVGQRGDVATGANVVDGLPDFQTGADRLA